MLMKGQTEVGRCDGRGAEGRLVQAARRWVVDRPTVPQVHLAVNDEGADEVPISGANVEAEHISPVVKQRSNVLILSEFLD